MTILKIINFGGFFEISSSFASLRSTCNNFTYDFSAGAYILTGEIDSGGWAFSSVLCSNTVKNDCLLDPETRFFYMENEASLDEIRKHSCDIDDLSKDGEGKKSIRKRVEDGLKRNRLNYTTEEIRKLFCIHEDRFDRPIYGVGNEYICCNAAIGFANNKKIFCFPWISKLRMETVVMRVRYLCELLAKLDCVVLVPISNQITSFKDFTTIPFPYNRPSDYYSSEDTLPDPNQCIDTMQ